MSEIYLLYSSHGNLSGALCKKPPLMLITVSLQGKPYFHWHITSKNKKEIEDVLDDYDANYKVISGEEFLKDYPEVIKHMSAKEVAQIKL